MFKSNIVFATLAMALFLTAQASGWNLFESDAAQTSRPSTAGTGARTYHK